MRNWFSTIGECVSKFDSQGRLVVLIFRRQLSPNRLLAIPRTVGNSSRQAAEQSLSYTPVFAPWNRIGVRLHFAQKVLYCRAHWTAHWNQGFVGTKGSKTVIWEVACPVHGPHRVRQKTEPTICKIKVQLSPRYVRQCRKRLTSAVQIRQKKRQHTSSIPRAHAQGG